MAVREIRLFGDAVLRAAADEVTTFDDSTAALAHDLLDTLDLPGRAGVAAAQIGVPMRAFSDAAEGGVMFN